MCVFHQNSEVRDLHPLSAANRSSSLRLRTSRRPSYLHAGTEGEIDAVFASLAQARIGAVLVPAEALFNSRITQIIALEARYAVPSVCAIREFPLAGGLISYGYSLTEAYRLAGLHMARILNGEKPADLPVLRAAMNGLVINLKTAKALSLTVPPTLLARADEIVE